MFSLTNTTGEIPARYLAQMRLVTEKAKLTPVLASAFVEGAAARAMTPVMAEKAIAGMAFLAANDTARTVDDATLVKLVDELLTKIMGGVEVDSVAVAKDLLLTYVAGESEKMGTVTRSAQGQTSSVGQSWDSPRGIAMKAADALKAQIGARMGLKIEPTMGRDMREFSLANVAMDLCRAAGLRPYNGADAIRMAGQHTATDFSYTVASGLSGVVAQGFQAAEPAIVKCATEVPAADYRQRNSVGLSGSAVPGKLVEGKKIEYTTVLEKGELAAKPDDYATIFSVGNQTLQNDSTAMNLFADIGRKMVIGAVAQFRNVLIAPLVANAGAGQTMADTLALFHANHGNLAAVPSALTVASVSVARTAMRRQKDAQGTILGLEPLYLLVPPELETTAQQMVATLMATKTSDVNPFTGQLEVVCDAGLSNMTAWYLLADPATANGLTYAYLEGASAPRVETRDGWDTLGMKFRLTWAVGAAFIETQSWYRNAGV